MNKRNTFLTILLFSLFAFTTLLSPVSARETKPEPPPSSQDPSTWKLTNTYSITGTVKPGTIRIWINHDLSSQTPIRVVVKRNGTTVADLKNLTNTGLIHSMHNEASDTISISVYDCRDSACNNASYGYTAPNTNTPWENTCGTGLKRPDGQYFDILSIADFLQSLPKDSISNRKVLCLADSQEHPEDKDFNDYALVVSYNPDVSVSKPPPITTTPSDTPTDTPTPTITTTPTPTEDPSDTPTVTPTHKPGETGFSFENSLVVGTILYALGIAFAISGKALSRVMTRVVE